MQTERVSPPAGITRHKGLPPAPAHIPPALAHDVKGLAAPLQIISDELTGSPDARLRLLGTRIETCVHRIVAVCDPALPGRAGPGAAQAPLRDVLDDVASMTEFLAGPNTHLATDLAPGAAEIGVDPRVFRVLFNLTANAVHAVNANGGGRVTLSARVEPGVLCIDIADDAGGVRPRAAPAASPAGHGLGLIIAEALALSLGGALDLVRTGPGGTRLRVCLPLSRH